MISSTIIIITVTITIIMIMASITMFININSTSAASTEFFSSVKSFEFELQWVSSVVRVINTWLQWVGPMCNHQL